MANERNPYEFDESAVFVAPPEEFPDDIEPPEWPKWVGGVGLAIGALSTCCSLMSAASTAVMPRIMQMASQSGQSMDLPPVYFSPPLSMRLSLAAKVVMALLLIIAAAMCLARKPASRILHLVWAPLSIGVFLWATYAALQMQAQVVQWINDNPDSEFAQLTGSSMQGSMSQFIGIGIDALISLPWPIFCLIWFGAVKRRPQDFGPPSTGI